YSARIRASSWTALAERSRSCLGRRGSAGAATPPSWCPTDRTSSRTVVAVPTATPPVAAKVYGCLASPDQRGRGKLSGMTRPLLLIDAASLYFRAYFGVPESAFTAPDGTPVNAVRGFLDMVATLVRGRRPGRLVCALDADWRPAWRVAVLPQYKAHRLSPEGGEITPAGLEAQVPVIIDVLDALGVPAVGVAGYEADDVIGTLAAREPGPTEVATGDRDLFQVIDDARGVRVLYTGRGVAKLEVYDDATVRAKYGVPAA